MKKIIFLIIINTILVIFIIPLIICANFVEKPKNLETEKLDVHTPEISETDKVNEIEITKNDLNVFEEYIKGVVGAEMPALFDEEALKAQAVCARTYAFRELKATGKSIDVMPNPDDIGQAYLSNDELKKIWKDDFDVYYSRIEKAVNDTKGEIMVYNDEPILAVFHSTSGGKTENSENIWKNPLPYLKSVDSKGDEKAPNFIYEKSIKNSEIIDKIHKKYNYIDKDNIIDSFDIGEISDAGYVLNVNVCDEKISARDIRSMFGLRSTNFTIEKNDDSIIFTTKGYGHGAGMSQYGAQAMANEGYNYKQILSHYYTNIDFKNIN